MTIIDNINDLPFIDKGFLTIGTFDGFHKGHKEIINQLCSDKEREGGRTIVITFSNHPFETLYPNFAPKKLSSLDFKISFLKNKGIDCLILIKFTEEFSKISHEDFFSRIIKSFSSLKMVLGDDFKFGYGNKGDINYLKQMQKKNYFELDIVQQISFDGERISSTIIRQYLKNGNIEMANKLLQREYFIDGYVISGDKIGREIGFPTINICNSEQIYPDTGVYKTITQIENKTYQSMTFVGRKSIASNNSSNILIETNIFDFDENIYDQYVKIFFQKKIRNEMKFESINDLKQQLSIDKKMILDLINKKNKAIIT